MTVDRDSGSSTQQVGSDDEVAHSGGESLPEEERHRVLYEWNDTAAPYPTDLCVHHLFERQVALTPDDVALVFEDQRISYRDLDRRANGLAQQLISLGVGPETLVGLCTTRSPDMIVGVLGILKAGGAYVALDPAYPKVRLAFMIEDAALPVLLTQSDMVDDLPTSGAKLVFLDEEVAFVDQPLEAPTVHVAPNNLAYVLYTSGSTGRPKGVAIEHRSVVAFLSWAMSVFSPTELAGVLAGSSICFDLSVFEIFLPLSCGGTVILAENVLALATLPARNEITLVNTVPTAMAALVNVGAVPPNVRVVTLGGEPLSNRLAQEIHALGFVEKVYNLYGPCEDTTYSTFILTEKGATTTPTIGRPISNTQAYVLDAQLRPLPVGATGEVCLGGDGLARGYLHRPELTDERFVANPFRPGRIYRTGDLARFLPDGTMESLGRVDYQVKIRGHRIELGEIEGSLERHPAVEKAVVLALPDAQGEKQLVAYVVAKSSALEGVADAPAGGDTPEHVALWRSVYEETYRHAAAATTDVTLNTTGWISSFTGKPIPTAEMRSWVENTVACILELEPEDVLEIGCGTGMLLARVAPHCSSYVGLDFSPAALEHIRSMQESVPGLGHIRLLERNADQLDDFEPASFNTVVINSVVQHFPDVEYLLRVIDGAVRVVRPGGHVLVGDVINLSLLETFHTSVQLHRAASSDTCEQVRQRIGRQVAHERDLQLDPRFFLALAQRNPQVTHVQIQPKRGRDRNQLTNFRYEAILHVGAPVPRADDVTWLDWQGQSLTLDDVRQRLAAERPETLGIRNIPNARLEDEAAAQARLHDADPRQTIGQFRGDLEQQARTGIKPEDLLALAEAVGYRGELSWLNAGASGALEVVFTREDQPPCAATFAADLPPRSRLSDFANPPQRTMLTRQLITELRESLKETLPGYMAPAVMTVIDRLPHTPNGKIDRRALAELPLEQERPADDGEVGAAHTPLEHLLAELWANVLNLRRVGVQDDFFALGGNSLQALAFVSKLQKRIKRDVQPLALFDRPTIAGFAAYLEGIHPELGTDLASVTAGSDREEGEI